MIPYQVYHQQTLGTDRRPWAGNKWWRGGGEGWWGDRMIDMLLREAIFESFISWFCNPVSENSSTYGRELIGG
jgi:hypothetical protein